VAEGVRRNYSIAHRRPARSCASRSSIFPAGAFSSFVPRTQAGDVLELLTPTGSFRTPLDPLAQKHYVGLAAGSGITPVLSILETVMEIETRALHPDSTATTPKNRTMFRHDLDRLESRYGRSLEILHVLSSDPRHPRAARLIDDEKLQRWLTTSLRPETVANGSCAVDRP